jgi:hypothetical protein
MLIENTFEDTILGKTSESLLMLTSTRGGVNDTLAKAETVIARCCVPSKVVTTVTPLGQDESAALKSSEDTVTIHLRGRLT